MMQGEMQGMGMGMPVDPDYGENISLSGTLGGKNDFDRRKKKRYNPFAMFYFRLLFLVLCKFTFC